MKKSQSSIFLEGSKRSKDETIGCPLEALPLSPGPLICDAVRGVSAWLINMSSFGKLALSPPDPYGLGTPV